MLRNIAISLSTSLLFLCTTNAAAQPYDIEIQLAKFTSGEYQRPYVAVWIANDKNKSQQVLQLWQERERWLKDLKYFWRRVLRKDPSSIDGVTGATRGPGLHHFSWDGYGKSGELAAGNYKLCAEVAREHGGHDAKCLPFKHPLKKAQQLKLQGEFTLLRIEAK